jgi:hypothetical protein
MPTTPARQPASLGNRGQFYAYDLYSDNTITFEQDAVIQNLYYCGIYFFSGGDCNTYGNWYVVGYNGGLYSIDKDTGEYQFIAITIPCNSLVYDWTTYTWYVCSYQSTDALYTIDITTGDTTYIGDFGQGGNIMISLMCDAHGNMYAYDVLFGGNSHLYDIDKSTGAASNPRDMGHNFCYAQEGKFDLMDDTLYLAAWDFNEWQSYLATCDPDTGEVTILNYFSPNDEIDAFVVPMTWMVPGVGVKKIIAPVSGNAAIITPEVTVKNYGWDDENDTPVRMRIWKIQYTDYLVEDFEGSFPPAGWTVQTISGGSWHRNDFWSPPRHNNAGTGYCADADVNMEQNAPMLTFLTTPPINLSAVPNAVLDVDSYEYVYYDDILLIDVSVDGGNTWINLYKVTGVYESGKLTHVHKDLSAYIGYSDMRLRFGYFAASTFDGYWEIDNVKVRSYNWNLEYDQTLYEDIPAWKTMNVTLPDWTPSDLGGSERVTLEYVVNATTQYEDNYRPNWYKQKTFTLYFGYFHDVAITAINSPQSGPAQTQPCQVVLENRGQNNEHVNVTMQIGKITSQTLLYSQDFSGGVFPSDWGTTDRNNWQVWYDNIAGGVAPELVFYYYPYIIGTSRAYSQVFDTTSDATLELSFKQCVYYPPGNNYQLKVQYSTDGGTTWADAYTQPGGSYGPTTTTVVMPGGVPSFQFAFAFEGSSMNNIHYWFIDDVELDSIPIIVEYNQTVNVNIKTGATMNVTLPDWTPADVPLATDVYYVIHAAAFLNTSDESIVDNELSKVITLSYEHDIGISIITEPSGPDGTWPPGTYSIQGIVQNYGQTFTESDFNVNAQVTNATGVMVYNETVTVTDPVAPGDNITVDFPDITIPADPAQERIHKLTMKTLLANDSNPNNDMKTLFFVIQIPDTTPPVTHAYVSGPQGKNGWYVGPVEIRFEAYDPDKMAKGDQGSWPSGVNHTYYRIDGGAWTVYTDPFFIPTDMAIFTIYYFSDDKAGNVEPEKNITIKIDGEINDVDMPVNTKQNLVGTEWLISVNATDVASGIEKVEFYVDDVLVGNDTTAPYEFLYEGEIQDHTQALAYDNAGNTKFSPIAYEYGSGEYTSQSVKIAAKLLG